MAHKQAWGPQARRFQLTLAGVVILTGAVAGVQADTLHVPIPYLTIQEAIDAAVDGDTVLVADGTYTGPGNRDLDFGGKAITLQSENGPGDCTIRIQGTDRDPHRAFRFHTQETDDSVVQGFKIRNGFMNRGGAVLCEDGSSPLFQSCVFQQNSVSQAVEEDGGGAVYILGSSPAFIECDFLQNQAEANFLFGGGGAVRIQSDSSPTFVGCTFNGNTAFGPEQPDGGAVAIWDGGHPEFFSCTFTENQAVWDGAVLCFQASVTMHDCHFQDNVATTEAAGAFGHYDFEVGCSTSSTLVNCSFIGNSALFDGGGGVVLNGNDGTEGVDVCATLTNCLFEGNQSASGGAMWIGRGVDATVTNCSFSGNTSVGGNGGGAVRVLAEVFAQFTNCTFEQNSATSGNGGGLRVNNGADATVTNCTFAQNAALSGGGIRVDNNGSATVDNCVLWDNLPQQISLSAPGPVSVSYSDIQGGWPGEGSNNIETDPLFVDPDGPDNDPDTYEDNDYRLGAGSQAIDAADNTAVPSDTTDLDDDGDTDEPIPFDLGGNPRFVNDPDTDDCPQAPGTCGDAPVVDMGSYEFQLCPADFDGSGDVEAFDLAQLLGAWGPCPKPCEPGDPAGTCAADLDGDCVVEAFDLALLLGNWGPCE